MNNIENEIRLLGSIIGDLNQERNIIIIRYVLPLLSYLDKKSYTFENLSNMFPGCLGNVMNLIINEYVLTSLIEMNNLNITIKEFIDTDWESFNDLSKCDICDKLEVLLICKEAHNDECAYEFSTLTKGCNKGICEDCMGINCKEADQKCNSIRCLDCCNL